MIHRDENKLLILRLLASEDEDEAITVSGVPLAIHQTQRYRWV